MSYAIRPPKYIISKPLPLSKREFNDALKPIAGRKRVAAQGMRFHQGYEAFHKTRVLVGDTFLYSNLIISVHVLRESRALRAPQTKQHEPGRPSIRPTPRIH